MIVESLGNIWSARKSLYMGWNTLFIGAFIISHSRSLWVESRQGVDVEGVLASTLHPRAGGGGGRMALVLEPVPPRFVPFVLERTKSMASALLQISNRYITYTRFFWLCYVNIFVIKSPT